MNDKELREGHEMYNRQTEKTFQGSSSNEREDHVETENEGSRGETEGSAYGDSDEEELAHKKKKRRRTRGNKTVEVKLRSTRNKNVEVKVESKTPKKTKKGPVIDVEAIILSGGKNSVTNKTVEALTPDEKMEMLGSAGKTLMLLKEECGCKQ